MGELNDALSTAGQPSAETQTLLDKAADAAHATSTAVNDAIEAGREPGMPLEMLARWTRQAPLQALLAAFIVGVMVARR
jgi:hypothetical protein